MPNSPYMQKSSGRVIVLLLIMVMGLQLCLVAYVFGSAYSQRKTTWQNLVTGCERGKKDRAANASGWRTAEAARRADGQDDVADKYAGIASGLEIRSLIVCVDAFKKPELLPGVAP